MPATCSLRAMAVSNLQQHGLTSDLRWFIHIAFHTHQRVEVCPG
jgi:hypothetical protein